MDVLDRTRPGLPSGGRSAVRVSGRLALGLIVLAIGVLFTLDNLGVLDAHDYLRYWPSILIVYGLVRFAGACCTSDRLWGGLWVVVGGWLLLNELDIVSISIWKLWPLFLVFLGLSIMLRSVRGPQPPAAGTVSGDRLSAFAFMSGVDRTYTSPAFVGGEATAVMGGCQIDLRQAGLAGGTAVVDLFAFWGGIDLIVPGDWTVKNEAIALLGGVEDSRTQTAGVPSKQLIVRGYAIMGGIEIKG